MTKQVYIIRKYVLANSATEAIHKDKSTKVHDVWLEETAQKEIVYNMSKNGELTRFGLKIKPERK